MRKFVLILAILLTGLLGFAQDKSQSLEENKTYYDFSFSENFYYVKGLFTEKRRGFANSMFHH